MATFMTGDTSGGVKKASGVVLGASLTETWARVRDNGDTSVNWMLCGYSSKTNIDVIVSGAGSLSELEVEVANSKYDDQCLFGGYRDGEKFAHFTYVGAQAGAMARGRASLHKNAVLNVLEGCVKEVNLIQGESNNTAASTSSIAVAADAALVSVPVPRESEVVSGPTKASLFDTLTEDEFIAAFQMGRSEFELLPAWKKANAKKSRGMF